MFVDGVLVGTIDRRLGEKSLDLPKSATPHPVLDVLVEGMGHINFAQEMIDRKGITDRVTLSGMTLMNWDVHLLPLGEAGDCAEGDAAPGVDAGTAAGATAGAPPCTPRGVLPRLLHARQASRHLHRHDRLPEGCRLGERPQPRPLLGHRTADRALRAGALSPAGRNDVVVLDLLKTDASPLRGRRR